MKGTAASHLGAAPHDPHTFAPLWPPAPLATCCAAPLVMENGRNLIDMVCEAYESPEQEQQQEQQLQEQEQQADCGTGQAGGAGGGGEAEEEQTPPPEFNFSQCAAAGAASARCCRPGAVAGGVAAVTVPVLVAAAA